VSQPRNYFANATVCSKRTPKTRVAMQALLDKNIVRYHYPVDKNFSSQSLIQGI